MIGAIIGAVVGVLAIGFALSAWATHVYLNDETKQPKIKNNTEEHAEDLKDLQQELETSNVANKESAKSKQKVETKETIKENEEIEELELKK